MVFFSSCVGDPGGDLKIDIYSNKRGNSCFRKQERMLPLLIGDFVLIKLWLLVLSAHKFIFFLKMEKKVFPIRKCVQDGFFLYISSTFRICGIFFLKFFLFSYYRRRGNDACFLNVRRKFVIRRASMMNHFYKRNEYHQKKEIHCSFSYLGNSFSDIESFSY